MQDIWKPNHQRKFQTLRREVLAGRQSDVEFDGRPSRARTTGSPSGNECESDSESRSDSDSSSESLEYSVEIEREPETLSNKGWYGCS
jgi:hypothetical protein